MRILAFAVGGAVLSLIAYVGYLLTFDSSGPLELIAFVVVGVGIGAAAGLARPR